MTGFNGTSPRQIFRAQEMEMLALWSAGRDTLDIARALGIPESEVYNRLPHRLQIAREDAEWNFDLLNRRHPVFA